jgi:hypothetical protein
MAKHISQLCRGNFDRGGSSLTVEFIFDPSDPLEVVTMIFRYPNGGAEWTTSREVIVDTFEKGAGGIGDLCLSLKLDKVLLRIRGEDGDADVVIDGYALESFYKAIKQVVPHPRRSVERAIDTVLERILKDG